MNPPSAIERATESAAPAARGPGQLFSAFGVEIEYMIVDRRTFEVRPIADQLLSELAGQRDSSPVNDVERGPIAWSNELCLHVIELKGNGPAPSLVSLVNPFEDAIRAANSALAKWNAVLMPGGMHPTMQPAQRQLWPHDGQEIYQAFDRIFDCRGHGWSNLQSMHLNLPFAGDTEFVRLHAAIRVLLPLLPALAASSPLMEGRRAPNLDQRMEVYRHNCRKIPEITGRVVPESVGSISEYHERILKPMYEAIAPLDPDGILRHEWLNARGAIARWERNTIEIRVLDAQETPAADLAIGWLVSQVLESLIGERWSDWVSQNGLVTEALEKVFLSTVRSAEAAVISDREYLAVFGIHQPCKAAKIWDYLIEKMATPPAPFCPPMETIQKAGPLARRILFLATRDRQPAFPKTARLLCHCLDRGELFLPNGVAGQCAVDAAEAIKSVSKRSN